MTRDQLIEKVRAINIWRRGGQRAPHKPLLLLMALARVRQGRPRLISYAEVDRELRGLLIEFGPTRKSCHPEYPFWRLQNDALWTLTNTDRLEARRSNKDAKKSSLLAHDVHGGFTPEIYAVLRTDPTLIDTLAQLILAAHFPASMHEDLLEAVGLEMGLQTVTRRKRNPAFRDRVLRAYAYRCAVCGFDVRIDNRTIGVEAAHMQWHQAGGPDDEVNGIALCTMHHKLLDRGAFRVTPQYRLLVSERVHGTAGLAEWLLRFHGQAIQRPARHTYALHPEYLAWHVREVYKSPDRVPTG